MANDLPLSRALVTGATGFIGSRLVPSLVERGVEVVACSRVTRASEDVQWAALDLPQPPPASVLAGVDVVFHLAGRAHALAESPSDERLYERVNEQGTRALAAAAAATGVRRFVLMSSVKAMRA